MAKIRRAIIITPKFIGDSRGDIMTVEGDYDEEHEGVVRFDWGTNNHLKRHMFWCNREDFEFLTVKQYYEKR